MFLPKAKKLAAILAAVLVLVFGGMASAAEQPCQFGRTRPDYRSAQQQSCNQSYGSTVAGANANFLAACPLPSSEAKTAAAAQSNSCANGQASGSQNRTQYGSNAAQFGSLAQYNGANCAQNGAQQSSQPSLCPVPTEKPQASQAPAEAPGSAQEPKPSEPAPSAPSQPIGSGMDAYAQEVVRQVNEERARQGLSPLTVDDQAVAAASVRAAEIAQSFSHTRPNGSDPFTALKEAGASYRGAGENIAKGQQSADR
ncbi:MAG: CAP domain-containing protein, partial [Christensenellaceae bacterium]|nr:CAP domain-containing protein [Christensenellaceae bacterium]